MNEAEHKTLAKDMLFANRDYCIDNLGGIDNPDFALHAMQAALAVARQRIRDDVLEKAAVKADTRYTEWCKPSARVTCDVTACEEIAAAIRAMKGKTDDKST